MMEQVVLDPVHDVHHQQPLTIYTQAPHNSLIIPSLWIILVILVLVFMIGFIVCLLIKNRSIRNCLNLAHQEKLASRRTQWANTIVKENKENACFDSDLDSDVLKTTLKEYYPPYPPL
jgi:hypothetical protein